MKLTTLLNRTARSLNRSAQRSIRAARKANNRKRRAVKINSPQEAETWRKISIVELNRQKWRTEQERTRKEHYQAIKLKEEAAQVAAKTRLIEAQAELTLAKAEAIREGKTGFEAELGFQVPKDAVYCSNCNYIDTTGKDTVCPRCEKHSPMLPVGR